MEMSYSFVPRDHKADQTDHTQRGIYVAPPSVMKKTVRLLLSDQVYSFIIVSWLASPSIISSLINSIFEAYCPAFICTHVHARNLQRLPEGIIVRLALFQSAVPVQCTYVQLVLPTPTPAGFCTLVYVLVKF